MTLVDGARVAVDGTGPALLLTSGMAGAGYDWEPLMPELARRARVLRIDRPGFGGSPPEPGVPSLRREVARLVAVVDELAPEGVVLVAHSVAAAHAEAMGRLRPDLLRGLVLLDPSCAPTAPTGTARPASATRGRRVISLLDALALWPVLGPALWLLMARAQCGGPVPESARRPAFRSFRTATAITSAWEEYTAFDGMLAALDSYRSSEFPAVPAHILSATGGMPTGSAAAWIRCHDHLADSLGASLRVLPDSRHMVMWDRPDAVLRAVDLVLEAAT